MKLIMENWRGFIADASNTPNYGDLYLFEGDSIKTVSFSQRFNSLRENEEDLKVFLEEWEKSAIYQLESLTEVAPPSVPAHLRKTRIDGAPTSTPKKIDPVTQVSTQAWLLLQKGKEGAKRVISILPKIKNAISKQAQKHPKLAKGATIGLGALGAAAIAMWVQAGGDAAALADMANQISTLVPEVAKDAMELVNNFSADAATDFVGDTTDRVIDYVEQSETEHGTVTRGVQSFTYHGHSAEIAMTLLEKAATEGITPDLIDGLKDFQTHPSLGGTVPALENVNLDNLTQEQAANLLDQVQASKERFELATGGDFAARVADMKLRAHAPIEGYDVTDQPYGPQGHGHLDPFGEPITPDWDPTGKYYPEAGGSASPEPQAVPLDTTPPGEGRQGAEFIKKIFQRRRGG